MTSSKDSVPGNAPAIIDQRPDIVLSKKSLEDAHDAIHDWLEQFVRVKRPPSWTTGEDGEAWIDKRAFPFTVEYDHDCEWPGRMKLHFHEYDCGDAYEFDWWVAYVSHHEVGDKVLVTYAEA